MSAGPGTPERSAAAGSTDVFLSYSRKDRDVVEWLDAELRALGKDVWVDWEDIPDWSQDYEAELEAAIRAAHTFVFVLSPASLASPSCRRELEVAVDNGKRIRPVLVAVVLDEAVPPALRKPQWLDLSHRDREALAKLVAALDVDPEWVQAHTRLLVRAEDWKTRGRAASLLLQGDDLRAAERQLEGQAGKDPAPTALQTEYVLASRRAASRRQRILLGSVIVALVVTVGLAVFAFVQRSNAIHDAKVARSRELATLSLEGSSDGRLALERALQAVDEETTPQAEDALRHALVRSREVGNVTGALPDRAFAGHGATAVYACPDGSIGRLVEGVTAACAKQGPYTGVTFTPDGRLAFERGAKAGRVVDAATGATLSTVPIREGQWSDGVAITPDGSRLLTLGAGRVARLWLVPERPGPARVVWRRRRVDEVALSPDGHRFATARKDGFVRVWDTRKAKLLTQLDNYGTISVEFRGDATVVTTDADLMRIWMLARPSRPVWESADALDLSPDGRLLLVGGRGRRIDIRSLARPAKTTASFRGALSDVPAFSPDSRLVVDSAEDGIRLWTVAGEQLGAFGNRAQQVVWSALSHDDGLLLTAGVDGVTRLWRISASPLLHTAAMPGRRLRRNDRPSPEKLVSNGRRTLVGLDDGTIVVWNGRGSDPIVLGSGPSRGPQAITPDGRRAATYDAKTIRVWDTKTGDQLTAIRAPYASSIALDDDGERVASTNGVHSIAVWRTSDGSPLASVYAPYVFREEDTLELHLAGDRLATGSGHLYDLSSKKPIPLRIPKDARTHVAFSPDGTLVAVGTPDDVRLFRTQDGALVRTLTGHQRQVGLDEGVLSVAFSTDGRRLLTTGTDETTRVWTVATGEQDHVLHDPYPRDGDLAPVFSPDGRLFAAPLGGGIAIWSVESGDRLMTVEGAAVPFAFTPDGSGIVTADDRTLRVHGCDACGSLEHLKALARRRLGG